MNEIIKYLTAQNRGWYNSQTIINKFSKDALNELWLSGKIEIRNGLNNKVIRLI